MKLNYSERLCGRARFEQGWKMHALRVLCVPGMGLSLEQVTITILI